MWRDDYEHEEQDNDGLYYPFMNKDVSMYRNECKEINEIISKYQKRIKQSLFVIGNYLYFTYNGLKYWTNISSSVEEEEYMNDIINELNCVNGVSKVKYRRGRLD